METSPAKNLGKADHHHLTLEEEGTLLLRESRMIIPGIQAIFGFQLMAVFSEGFGERLEKHHEIIHLLAMVLVLVGIALVMSPAVYQRRVEPRKISKDFIRLSGKMLVWGLRAFTLGLAADVGVITFAVTDSDTAALLLSLTALGFLTWLWFFFGTPLNFEAGTKAFNFLRKHAARVKTAAVSTGQKHLNRYTTALMNAGYKYLN